MKTYLLLILMSIFLNSSGASQGRISNYDNLTAKKNNRIHHYYTGERADVKYNDGNTIKDYRGILTAFIDNGIYLSSFKKKDTALQFILINSIVSVHSLLRKSRLVSGIITGISLAATILFISAAKASNNNNAADNFAGLFAIFSVTGVVSGSISFLSTYVTEIVNTKSIKRGWHFTVQ